MNPFSIHCTTCRRRLKVTDPGLIGHILACPGCGSMVLIEMPAEPNQSASGAGSTITLLPAAMIKPPAVRPPVQPANAGPFPVDFSVDPAELSSGPALPVASIPIEMSARSMRPAASVSGWQSHRPSAMWLGIGGLGVAVATALVIVAVAANRQPTAKPADSEERIIAAAQDEPRTTEAPAAVVPQPDGNSSTEASPKTEAKDEPAASTSTPPVAANQPPTDPPPAADSAAMSPPPAPPMAEAATPKRELKPDEDEYLDGADRASELAFHAAVPTIDWPARMGERLPGVTAKNLPLADFADMMSDLANVPVSLDVDALQELRLSPETPLTLQLTGTTVGAALDAALTPRGLRSSVSGGHLWITRAGDATATRSTSYTVSDLAPNAGELVRLATVVQALIAPDSWEATGGTGAIRLAEGALVIEHTNSVHYQVLVLCEKLRVARGLPLRSRIDAAAFRLDSRTDRAREKLIQPVTAVFPTPTPLSRVLGDLAKHTKTRLLIDARALEIAGLMPDPLVTLKAERQPLATSLASMLEPAKLAYRAVDERTLLITANNGFRREIEFYSVRDLITAGVTAEQIVQRVQAEVAPTRWSAAGGKGTLLVDPASQRLIVSHAQPIQRQVQALLGRWRPDANGVAAQGSTPR